eukprot:TRINITY_DN17544_c0_g1_i2.p1 TRINITY_DN17544_c0_g1~~TRINITY_DN17544_c0_g1_i2.p1  ORF type:complete len:174 (-),score=25.13 TRINITY_DN17544_c0_g1_i2:129-599(-)
MNPLERLDEYARNITPHDVEKLMENCLVKSAMGGGAGLALGFGIGVFFSSTQYDIPAGYENSTTWTKVKEGFKATGRQGWSSAKNFGTISVVFSGTECVIEKYRGKTDLWNGVYAGCATGAVFGVRDFIAGPKAALAGCAGFAAFSATIEYLLFRH